jgi:tetratricopeptide (TPR) repeat protein
MSTVDHLATARRLLGSGSWLEAEAAARAALSARPDEPQALLVLGLAIAAMGQAERAAPSLNAAAAGQPDAPHSCETVSNIMPSLPRLLVRRQFRACLRLSPANRRLRLAFAEFLLDNDWAPDAEAELVQDLEDAAGYHLLGLVQAEQARFKAAIGSFGRAAELDPLAAASWSNLGMVLKTEDRFREAIAAHDRAVGLAPEDPRFRVNRAVALLKAGRWEQAWQDYEWRLRLGGAAAISLNRLLPSLSELGDLSELTIVALHEEGFGDTLQFLRYLPPLAERGARVIACVPQPLVRLMRMVPGVAQVVTDAKRLPPHDFVCPFFSLPRAFGTTVHTIPPAPRLRPDPALTHQWLSRLPRDGVLAGLVWAGQARPWLPGFRTLDRRRGIGLAALQPLTGVSGVHFVSLQMGPAARQAPPAGMRLLNPMPKFADFAETAALIAALDVVISVDTSVVHLAALLGKPVFLLDRYDGCWRWLSERTDSPWYPDLTIFRQEQPNDWAVPMARATASLEALALFRGAPYAHTAGHGMSEPAFVA